MESRPKWYAGFNRRTLAGIIPRKTHRLDTIAVRIDDEGCVVAHAIVRAQTRRAVGAASGIRRARMERIDLAGRLCAKTDMDAAIRRDRHHGGTQVDPELRIAFAETDRRRPRDKPRKPERRQRQFVKPPGALQVTDAEGNMIDHGRHRWCLPSLRGAKRRSNP